MDFLKLEVKAERFRFRVQAAGTNELASPPALNVVVSAPTTTSVTPAKRIAKVPPARVLDVPLRRQLNTEGVWIKDRCQSAALASALQYFGRTVPLEDILPHTFDPEYGYPGIWPRVIGAAAEFGVDGYIERFRDWAAVRQALAENKLILCSIRLKAGECQSPPYASMGNHIVVLNGISEDGRVVVTDSALGKSGTGYLCQWWQSDFAKIWMQTKGGVAMVLCPPAGAVPQVVTNLPAFPVGRTFPVGDDH
jgi:hypothetical protein